MSVSSLPPQAWLKVADELGYPRPLGQTFRRVKGLRDDVVVQRIFNWTQNPPMAKKIAERKSEVYHELLGGRQPAEMLEARPFLEMLHRYNIPVAVACALPEKRVQAGLGRHGLDEHFEAVVTAEDGGATEAEWYYMYAGQRIQVGRALLERVEAEEEYHDVSGITYFWILPLLLSLLTCSAPPCAALSSGTPTHPWKQRMNWA